MPVAAIDCGTNSLRLLIAERPADNSADGAAHRAALKDLTRRMRIVRLGEGVDASGELTDAALQRAFAAAAEYGEAIAQAAVSASRCVATSAIRDVSNRDRFISGMTQRLGVAPEVISGEEEARLSFTGAITAVADAAASPKASAQTGEELTCVVDIGGGSTELVLGTRSGGPIGAYSMNIGSVRMFERHLREVEAADLTNSPRDRAQLAAAGQAVRADVREHLAQAHQHLDLSAARTIIGTAGTVTTVAAHVLNLPGYRPDCTHGAALTRANLIAACHQLANATRRERAALPFMPAGREDVIGAGALVWATIIEYFSECQRWGESDPIIISEHDILDGIALALLDDVVAESSQ